MQDSLVTWDASVNVGVTVCVRKGIVTHEKETV